MAFHRYLWRPFLATAVLCDAFNVVLASYTYDALGRRITFTDPVAGTTTRYYYDGRSVIEERDAADARVRYHVNGNQFIDERVATFTQATGQFTYYLTNANYSIAGIGNADGSVQRLDYSSTGDFAGGGPGAWAFYHDADHDLDIDLLDVASLQRCFDPSGTQATQACLDAHDFDTADASDGDIDLDDYARLWGCLSGPSLTPDPACGMPGGRSGPPPSGTFTLHGRPVDMLSDGHALMDFRARNYDPALGRWLQRDLLPYNDGFNLYEPFRSNRSSHRDPTGEGILTWLPVGDHSLSRAQLIRPIGLELAVRGLLGRVASSGTESDLKSRSIRTRRT